MHTVQISLFLLLETTHFSSSNENLKTAFMFFYIYFISDILLKPHPKVTKLFCKLGLFNKFVHFCNIWPMKVYIFVQQHHLLGSLLSDWNLFVRNDQIPSLPLFFSSPYFADNLHLPITIHISVIWHEGIAWRLQNMHCYRLLHFALQFSLKTDLIINFY